MSGSSVQKRVRNNGASQTVLLMLFNRDLSGGSAEKKKEAGEVLPRALCRDQSSGLCLTADAKISSRSKTKNSRKEGRGMPLFDTIFFFFLGYI